MKSSIKLLLFFIVLFSFSACTPLSNITPTSSATQIPSKTPTPFKTFTPTPTFTMTPTKTPISIGEAITQGSFEEIDHIGKGKIEVSKFSPNGEWFVAVVKRGIYVFNVADWYEVKKIPLAMGNSVNAIAFSRDSSLFAIGDSTGDVRFWQTSDWEMVGSYDIYDGPITSLDISPDNLYFASIANEKELAIWNVENGELISSQIRSKRIGPVNYSTDGNWLMVSEMTGYRDLTIWNSPDLNFLNRIPHFGYRPPEQAVSPYDNKVASFSRGELSVYDFETRDKIVFPDLFYALNNIQQMFFLDKSNVILKSRLSDSYLIVNIDSSEKKELSSEDINKLIIDNKDAWIISMEDNIQSLGFDPSSRLKNISLDGKFLTTYQDNIINLDTYESKGFPVSLENPVLSSEGNLIFLKVPELPFPQKVKEGRIRIYYVDINDLSVQEYKMIDFDLIDGVQVSTVSPDGKLLAIGSHDGNLYLWDIETNEQIYSERLHNKVFGAFGMYGSYSNIIFNQDGSFFATEGYDEIIKVINRENFDLVTSVRGNKPAFSSNGKYLAYTTSDNKIHIISLTDNEPEIVLSGHTERINILLFSDDGSLLYSGGADSMVRVWSVQNKELLVELPQYTAVYSLALMPDNSMLYVWTLDGVIGVYGDSSY